MEREEDWAREDKYDAAAFGVLKPLPCDVIVCYNRTLRVLLTATGNSLYQPE